MTGRTISHYKILEKLGAGGMGVVYKAEDLSLKRSVALKFLSHHALGDGGDKVRFINEARTAASLDHPRICTVYEIAEAEGETFIAMAYLEGKTLRSKLEAGPLPLADAIDIATQVAEALEEAHMVKGIVHRDIKGANIMVNERGQVKIMDFGLAHLSDQTRITKTGMTVGTPAYMAPEQAEGKVVDARADLWSLGVVLYEMVTGQLPFKSIHFILNSPHRPLSDHRVGVPAELERVVERLLAKRPEARYATAADLLVDLRALRHEMETGSAAVSSTSRRVQTAPAIAVMPFVDMSQEKNQAYFCEGVAEDVINALARVEGLRVAPRGASFQYAGRAYDVVEVGQQLRVGMILEGSVRLSGSRLRINAQLIKVADGFPQWSKRFDGEMKDIFDVQDEISQAIVDELKIALIGDRQRLVKRFTDNLEAYHLYLKGRYHWNHRVPGAIRKALEYFQQALAEDPNYSPAYTGMADCYIIQGVHAMELAHKVMPVAKEAALKALDGDEMMAEAHTSLAAVHVLYEFDWESGEKSFRRALELNPNYPTAHSWFAIWHLTPLGRWDEALREAKRARDLEPLSPASNSAAGLVHYYRRDYDAAIRALQDSLDLDPNFALAHYYQARCWFQKGVREEVVSGFGKARQLLANNPGVMGTLGHSYAMWGMAAEARQVIEELQALTDRWYVSAHSFGLIHLGFGEFDLAMDWFEKAFEERSALLLWIKVDPVYDSLRENPRFIDLLRKMNLEPQDPRAGTTMTIARRD